MRSRIAHDAVVGAAGLEVARELAGAGVPIRDVEAERAGFSAVLADRRDRRLRGVGALAVVHAIAKPSRASRAAIAAPMPRLPPVTNTRRFMVRSYPVPRAERSS